MQTLTHLIEAFEKIAALTIFCAGFYALVFSQETRASHQVWLSAAFEYFASTSAIGVIRRTIGAVSGLLGWIYGPADTGGSIRDFVTLRAWQASFTIALIYVCVLPFLLVALFAAVLFVFDDFSQLSGKVLATMIIGVLAMSYAVFRGIRKRKQTMSATPVSFRAIFGEADRQSTMFAVVLLALQYAPPLLIAPTLVIPQVIFDVLTPVFFAYVIYFFVANVWVFGARGVLVFAALFLSVMTRIFLCIAVWVILTFVVDVFVLPERELSSREIFLLILPAFLSMWPLSSTRAVAIRFCGMLLLWGLLAAGGFITQIAQLMLASTTLFFVVFVVFVGFLIANSLLDLFSVSASRHFFRRAQVSATLKELLRFLVFDVFIAILCVVVAALIFFVAVLVGIGLFLAMQRVIPEAWLPLYAAGPSALTTMAHGALLAAALPFEWLYCSLVYGVSGEIGVCLAYDTDAPSTLFDRIGVDPETSRSLRWVFAVFFATTIVPTLINAITMIAAMLIKVGGHVLRPITMNAHGFVQKAANVPFLVGGAVAISGFMLVFLFATD